MAALANFLGVLLIIVVPTSSSRACEAVPETIIVTGTRRSAIDGTYVRAEEDYNARPQWKKNSVSDALFYFGSNGHWLIGALADRAADAGWVVSTDSGAVAATPLQVLHWNTSVNDARKRQVKSRIDERKSRTQLNMTDDSMYMIPREAWALNWTINITGTTPHLDWWSIDFVTGTPPDMNNVAFHYNPRPGQNVVVRNARLGGRWGEEELGGSFPTAFSSANKHVEVRVHHSFANDGFQVYTAGRRTPEFDFKTRNAMLVTAVPCAWRQTSTCSVTGPREPQNDLACDTSIHPDWSGFCDCNGDGVFGDFPEIDFGCGSKPFDTCSAACQASISLTVPGRYACKSFEVQNDLKLTKQAEEDCNETKRNLQQAMIVIGVFLVVVCVIIAAALWMAKDPFSYVIVDQEDDRKIVRRLRIMCPGVDKVRDVTIKSIFNGAVVEIHRPASPGLLACKWVKRFQFKPAGGPLELKEDHSQLEQGVLDIVFWAQEPEQRIFRFPAERMAAAFSRVSQRAAAGGAPADDASSGSWQVAPPPEGAGSSSESTAAGAGTCSDDVLGDSRTGLRERFAVHHAGALAGSSAGP